MFSSRPYQPDARGPDADDHTLRKLRKGLAAAAVFSAVINLLALSSPLYMMQIYDRVLSSKSMPTLVLLSLIFCALLILMGILDALRGQLLARLGNLLEHAYGPRLLRHVLSMTGGRDQAERRPLEDLRSVRAVLQGQSITALFDLPWFPFFLILVFLIHPVLGFVSLFGAVVLVGLVLRSQRITSARLPQLTEDRRREVSMMQAIARQPDAARALGMAPGLAGTWGRYDRAEIATETQMSDRLAVVSACSRTMRIIVQSAVLGFGAWLVIRQELSPGVMIGASIIMGRALAPIELAAANWQKLGEAKSAFGRLRALLPQLASRGEGIIATRPAGHIVVSNVFAVPRKSAPAALSGISFEVKAGQSLGVAGPAAAGKSTLARLLVGALAPVSGSVRLDGVELDRPDPQELGRYLGYLPQTLELLPGTVAQNISRFREDAKSEDIQAAARLAGVHDRVLRLPDGYETEVGSVTEQLSVGERQLIGLARALYGNPPLLVLDAPEANLDPDGQGILEEVLKQARANGATVVVVSHNPRILRHMDNVLLLSEGRVQRLSSREEFFSAAFQALPKSRAQD
jgi:PrtD family type I secretion system ABC transporter